jgi:uncharacterized protein (DUF305 family)
MRTFVREVPTMRDERRLERGGARAVAAWSAFLILTMTWSACSDSKTPGGDGGRDAATDMGVSDGGADGPAGASFAGDRRVPLTPADDVQFIDFFVPHHMAAIDMAMMVIDRGTTPAVKTLATNIKTAQTDEIAQMKAARSALTGVAESPMPPPDPHMEADMKAMMALSSPDLERMFLMDMIPHHAAGLPVAHRSVMVLTRSDLKTMAGNIYTAQAREIGEMKMLLGSTTGTAAVVAGDGGVDGGASDDTNPMGDRRIPYTAADDVAFIDFFLPHHMAAIDMADMVIAKGSASDLKAMAQMIKTSQTAEISLMRTARQALTGSADSPPPPADPHMDADMARMMTLAGDALDRMFIEEMIPHHAAGLPTAHRSKAHLARADMRKLADDIYDAQAKEIGDLERMREAASADGGVADASGQ